MHRESIPIFAEPHEEVVEDRIRSNPSLSTRHVRVAFRLVPTDLGIHRAEDGWDITQAEGILETGHDFCATHCSRSVLDLGLGQVLSTAKVRLKRSVYEWMR